MKRLLVRAETVIIAVLLVASTAMSIYSLFT